jgi:hypothetical protein
MAVKSGFRFRSRLPVPIAVLFVSILAAQASGPLRQDLTRRYTLTVVDPDGTVTRPGTVVSVGKHLLRANPIYGDRYQPNSYKNGRLSQPTLMKPSRDNIRLADSIGYLRFNEKVYITDIDVGGTEIVFKLQACAGFVGRPLAGEIYRAALSFQFPKGVLSLGNLKQIESTISEVLTVVGGADTSDGSILQSPPSSTLSSEVLGSYKNSARAGDQLQLAANGSFSLKQAGHSLAGRFSVQGNILTLKFSDGSSATGVVLENKIFDNEGQTWAREVVGNEASAFPSQTAPTIDLVHAGQTMDDVKTLLGPPDKIEEMKNTVVYSYTGLTILFVDGKVSRVQQ